MKKVFDYTFNYFIVLLFVLFSYLNITNANENNLLFEILTIVVSIIVILFVFILNKSKTIENRRIYIISMIASSLYLTVTMFQCMFISTLANISIYNYLKYFLFGGSISAILILIFLSFKNLFNKAYTITKLDFKNFNMIINSICYCLICLFLTLNLNIKLDPINYKEIVLFDINKNAILFILIGYSIAYAIIYLVYYLKFDKDK